MKKMQFEQIQSLEVRQEPTDMFNKHVDKWMESSVWATDCRSWYKMGTVDGKAWLWPGGVRLNHILYVGWYSANSRFKDPIISQNYQAATVRRLHHQIQEPEPVGLVSYG